MAEQLQAMISQYAGKCDQLSMCPEDCKADVTNAFTTCGPCLAGAEQLTQLPGLMQQKEQLESQKAGLESEISACECKDEWYYYPVTDPRTGEDLGQSEKQFFNGCDALKPDEAEPWCYVKDPAACSEATASAGIEGESLAWRYCSSKSAPQQRLEQVMAGLQEVTMGIQQLQMVQQACEATAPTLDTLHKQPVSLPQGGSCMQMVQRFGILKEVMTAQATGAMDGLSAGALEMLQGLGAQGESLQGGALQNNYQCVRQIDTTAGAVCTDDSQCSSGHCAEGTTHNLNTRHCFRINNRNSENCLAANDTSNQYPGHCNRCKDGYTWDDNYNCVAE